MPNIPISPPPGVFTVPTPLAAGLRWAASNLVRFFGGTVEKLGGCARLTSNTFVGICRGLFPFSDLAQNEYIAIGTTQRLQLYLGGNIIDITPVKSTSNLSGSFLSVVNGSATITVTDSITPAVGDWVNVATNCYFDSLDVQGFVQVSALGSGTWSFVAAGTANLTGSVGAHTATLTTTGSSAIITLTNGGHFTFVDASTFDLFAAVTVGGITVQPGAYVLTVTAGTATFTGPGPASGSASAQENGGSVELQYLLPTAVESAVAGSSAYGGGAYGAGPYGQGSSSNTPIGGWQRQWSLDFWGTGNENLIACPTGGGIYQWTPPVAVNNTATLVANAPTANTGVFTTMPAQQLMAFGAYDPTVSAQNPLLLRWTDVANNTVWTASATNQAGSYQIPLGTEIVRALQDDGQVLIWTDEDLWGAQYLGFPLVWGFTRIGRACGLLTKRAVCKIGGVWYWAGINSFWTYDGTSVQPLPCAVWDQFYGTANLAGVDYLGSIFFAADEQFGEFFCFFPLPGQTDECFNYVKFNRIENGGCWDYGTAPVGRSAWTSQSAFGNPIGADYNGLLQQHESASDWDTFPMDSWVQTGWIGIEDGDTILSVRRILTDFKILSGAEAMIVTVLFVDYLDGTDAPRAYGPFNVTASTPYIFLGGRGRYMAVKIESNTRTVWRAGKLLALARADGKR